jgi:FAD/FMN-containing dehydrogenase
MKIATLRRRVQGAVLEPSDSDFIAARHGWYRSVRQEPALVVVAESELDIVAAVEYARAQKLGVGVMSTGHGTADGCVGGVLIRTDRMDDVTVDVPSATTTVAAGARTEQVLDACGPHGLAPLSGFYSSVGVVGFTLGGGVGWLKRRFGPCSDTVASARVVLADGQVAMASKDHDADLLWAVRGGGGGNFGILTALTLGLVEVDEVFAGGVYFPIDHTGDLLGMFRDWTSSASTDVTGALMLAKFPDVDTVPVPLRGQSVVGFRACHLGSLPDAERDLGGFRTRAGALLDNFAQMPYRRIGEVSMETSKKPDSFVSFGALLNTLPDEAVPTLTDPTAPFVGLEIRHLGHVPKPESVAGEGFRAATYALYSASTPATPRAQTEARSYYQRLAELLRPGMADLHTLNFLGTANTDPDRVRRCFTEEHFARLVELKRRYDPKNTFRFSYNISPDDTR